MVRLPGGRSTSSTGSAALDTLSINSSKRAQGIDTTSPAKDVVALLGQLICVALSVGSAAILYLHTAPVPEVMHLRFAPYLIYSASHLFRVSSIPRLIHPVSHLFRFSPTLRLICSTSHKFRLSRFRPFPDSRILFRLQAPSRNQLCLT